MSISPLTSLGSSFQAPQSPGRLASLQSQIELLERRYADICGCQTTPRDEKLKAENTLSQQLATLRAQVDAIQGSASTSNAATQATQHGYTATAVAVSTGVDLRI
jgi:hypothetical protein